MRYMLDTNICIYAIKHKPVQVFERLKEHDPCEICISSITYAELIHRAMIVLSASLIIAVVVFSMDFIIQHLMAFVYPS